MSDIHVLYTTISDEDTARQLATVLVGENLAACVNILPNIVSVYQWEGNLQQESEVLMLVKTSVSNASKCKKRLESLHPYSTPMIISLGDVTANESYANWVKTGLV